MPTWYVVVAVCTKLLPSVDLSLHGATLQQQQLTLMASGHIVYRRYIIVQHVSPSIMEQIVYENTKMADGKRRPSTRMRAAWPCPATSRAANRCLSNLKNEKRLLCSMVHFSCIAGQRAVPGTILPLDILTAGRNSRCRRFLWSWWMVDGNNVHPRARNCSPVFGTNHSIYILCPQNGTAALKGII